MTITGTMSEPFYTGGPVTQITGRYDVALAGRPYLIDNRPSIYTGHSEFMHASVPLLRNQADQGTSPSEASINPSDLWRRSEDSWHHGAGQAFVDRKDSDPQRFHTSKGVNVWTAWQMSLLNDTASRRSSANTNLKLAPAGTRLYLIDGTALVYTSDVTPGSPTWTTVTGTPGAATDIATDGTNIWTAHGGSGIYTTTVSSGTSSSYVTGNVNLVGYLKGRLMAAYQNLLYNVTAAGALPAALLTHPNSGFTWVGFAEGSNQIYAAGYSGDKSLIYRTAVKADGTALDVPVVAGELPDGEIVRSIQGYLGFLMIGTDLGVRVAQPDSNGDLTIGALIPADNAVQCFEPQDRFCWYGLTNYDSSSTGLGRLDLSVETSALTPAYASDLMVTGQGTVLSVVTFQDRRVLAVSGLGVYLETVGTYVTSGTLQTGQITYQLPDDKVAMFVDVRHDGIGQHSMAISADGGSFANIGTAHTDSSDPFPANQKRAARFELRITLTAVANVSPVIRSITLRAYAAAATTEMVTAPLLLAEHLELRDGSTDTISPSFEVEFLTDLRRSRDLITWQEGPNSWAVVVDDYEWRPSHPTQDFSAWNGTIVMSLRIVN